MNFSAFTLTTLIYISVFTGCYIYLIWDLPFKFNRVLSILALAGGLAFFYIRSDSSLQVLLVRYLIFFAIYAVWSLVFLDIRPNYALYLSVFITVFMGIWVSCVQIALYSLHLNTRTPLTLATGFCRIFSIVIIKRFFIKIDASRSITIHEMLVGLFPAVACFVANLIVYDYLNFLTRYGIEKNIVFLHFSVVFFGLSAILVLLSSESYFQVIRYREEKERAENQLNAQYQLFLSEKENAEKFRAFRHDINNHLNTIEAMIKTEDVKKYISNLRKAEENTTVPFYTGCSTLDALLSTKSSLLKENNIQISCLVHFTNSDFLSPMELCTLFANSLDNAIEAVLPLPVENRFIRISGGEVNGNMVVRIENPYHHTLHRAGDRFISTKSDDHFHGYGLANMRKIIEAHNGTLTYKTENHIFSLFFMIPFPN